MWVKTTARSEVVRQKVNNNIAVLNVFYVTNVLTADDDVVAVYYFTHV